MYFKKLEIVGFKSFLNKTKLRFEPGVTAIVGPNGCGKSNVVDAVKWVFGEQSPRSMRGNTMQDVIFNGTDKYDPINMAEVSLTLSNENRILPVDYDEVTITRRLFRSGESEYLINKTPVRLMDVKDILFGTGLGTSSYSVIEQGKMDMVLSSKPEERRFVFEEASGITRYKAKKKEALFKLERTQHNLTRINDIISEVERQIKSIERQARKAEKYRAYYEELKSLEVKLSYGKYKELSADSTDMDQKAEEMRNISDTSKRELDEMNISLAEQRKAFNAVLEDLQASESDIMRLSSDVDKNRHTMEVNGERIQELQRYVQRLDREIEETTERKEALEKRMEEMEARCEDVTNRRESKEKECSQAEEKVRNILNTMEQHKHQLKFNREKTMDLLAERTQSKNALIKINADIHNMMAREKRLKLERANVEKEKEGISEKLRVAEETARKAKKELDACKLEFDAFNNEHISRQEKLSALKNEKYGKEKRLNELKPRIEFLEKLIAEREGINESAKEIMRRVEERSPGFAGVHGILSEIISVREGFEESLESVLGDLSQAVVVDSRAAAGRVMEFLEKTSKRSVNFLILDELADLRNGEGIQSIFKGTLDDITAILTAKEPYRSALCGLLKDTFVTSASEIADVFVRDKSFHGRVMCEKGEVYRKGAHRSKNYSDKEATSLFGRRERLTEMLSEEKQVTDELSQIGMHVAKLEDWLKASQAKKAILENRLKEKEIEHADLSSKSSAIKEKDNALADELLLLNTEIEEESESIKEMNMESEKLDARLAGLEDENGRIEQRIEESQKIMQDSASDREKTLFRISDIKAELSALRKEEEHLKENLEREGENYSRIDREVTERRERITESGERAKTLGEETKDFEAKNEEYIALKETRISENKEKKEEKNSLTRGISEAEGQVREKEGKLESHRNQAVDLDLKRKELEYKCGALAQRILDAYKVNLAGYEMEKDETFDPLKAEDAITELKNKLERMGEVSLGAVEEHKQLEERYAFLARQRDDLTKGREDIMRAIAKINHTTRKLFMETFEAIKKEFNVYFKMLFNGGRAELVLEDEHDLLECGIDIVVRPPGKKLQNIMLLSGGEKAMTAIALIFAIFKVNPSPFCVLDEVDAPLDESNIVRFCRVLTEFLKLSQFIIVTHNRMTIQLADILYGITMEEKGISKIVSVKLTEEKEQPAEEPVHVAT